MENLGPIYIQEEITKLKLNLKLCLTLNFVN